MAVFVPHVARTNDVSWSLGQALPLLFTCMSTFIANDLDDEDRDATNHPARPLPGQALTRRGAAVLFFVCLGAALFSTRYFVDPRTAFWYYGLIATSVSYGYVVDALPTLKAPYVAATVVVPIFMVWRAYPEDSRLLLVACAGFLATLGRETCMDIRDRSGDPPSFMHRLPARPLAAAAFLMQVMAVLMLAAVVDGLIDFAAILVMSTTLLVSGHYWFRLGRLRTSILLMKLQFAAGLVFLA